MKVAEAMTNDNLRKRRHSGDLPRAKQTKEGAWEDRGTFMSNFKLRAEEPLVVP